MTEERSGKEELLKWINEYSFFAKIKEIKEEGGIIYGKTHIVIKSHLIDKINELL